MILLYKTLGKLVKQRRWSRVVSNVITEKERKRTEKDSIIPSDKSAVVDIISNNKSIGPTVILISGSGRLLLKLNVNNFSIV